MTEVGRRRAALLALAICVVAGIALRALAALAWWPASTTLGDPAAYSYFATADPFANPLHPPGYSLFLALGGLLTRQVAVFTIGQHLLGIVSALLIFAAVRRLCGSPWPALAGAAAILLGADQVYLERAIMSEALFVPLLAATVYAAARALEQPERWWPWPIAMALLAVLTGMTRSAGLFVIPVLGLALVLARPRPWLPRWRPVVAFLAAACVGLAAYAGANAISHDRFEVTPSSGWRLYGRVAPFADCGRFDPPTRTARLCESRPPSERPGPDWYLFDTRSPAMRTFGRAPFERDEELGAFARRAIRHQPRAYLAAVLDDLESYFVPGSFEPGPGRGADLDVQLGWTAPAAPGMVRATKRGMETFFDPLTVDRSPRLLSFLNGYQRVFRFGAVALAVTTMLILIGLLVGPRRNRVAVLVLGVGGLAMIALPTFSVVYIERYTVPAASLLVAGAAIAAMSLARRVKRLTRDSIAGWTSSTGRSDSRAGITRSSSRRDE
jgi:hypothetical protein